VPEVSLMLKLEINEKRSLLASGSLIERC